MIQAGMLLLMVLLGMAVGAVYFIWLWKTVSHIPQAKHPMLLTFGGFFGRMIMTVGVFALVAVGGHWDRLLACMIGFLISRFILVRRFQRLRPEK